MHEAEKLSLDQIQAFLQASQTIRFEGESRSQVYHWIEQVLCLQQYHQQSRGAQGLIRLYLAKMTGLSRAQVTRLVARYRRHGTVQPRVYRPGEIGQPVSQLTNLAPRGHGRGEKYHGWTNRRNSQDVHPRPCKM